MDTEYGTKLWDANRQAANGLRGNGLPGRTIIMVTNGQDTTSKTTLQDPIKAARAAHVCGYTIGTPDSTHEPNPLD